MIHPGCPPDKRVEAWSKQKAMDGINIPNPQRMLEIAEAIPNPRTKALFAALYLTAARIGEVVKGRYNIKKPMCIENIIVEEHDGREWTNIILGNEKAKKQKLKEKKVTLDPNNKIDNKMLQMIFDYYDYSHSTPLFRIGTKRGYQLISKAAGMNPHFIRHIRLTHLCHKYNFTEHELMKVAGWTDTRPSSVYIETRWGDIADRWTKNKEFEKNL